MRYNFVTFLLLSVGIQFSYEFTTSLSLINPRGFRIITLNYLTDDRIKYVTFYVNIERPVVPGSPTDFVAVITESTNGQWEYINVNARVEGGRKIFYRLDVFHDYFNPISYNTPVSSFTKVDELPYYPIDIISPSEETCSLLYRKRDRCEMSVTTVRGQTVCSGQLIFEEHFDTLRTRMWKIDARIPSDMVDSPFVSFQNDPDVVYVENGWLHIKPKLLSDAPGFNESSLKTGTLKIDGCSGTEEECVRKARYSQILPPVISARMRTKHSFTFQYGKVIIGAQMPKGDWITPMLLLEPLENFYGPLNYASGQIRIANLRANQFLETSEGIDISNRNLSAGVVLEDQGPLHEAGFRQYHTGERIPEEAHNFTLTWTETYIAVGIDGQEYGKIDGSFSKLFPFKNSNCWDSAQIMTPFDREFYLTIGLSVGGHSEFPDKCLSGEDRVMKPWVNNDPKAMLNFWKNRENWIKSWQRHNSQLQVNFIMVYAL